MIAIHLVVAATDFETGVIFHRNHLDEWLAHAELLTVKTIDRRAAAVLYALGISNLSVLAEQDAASLLDSYNNEVGRRDHATLQAVDLTRVQNWIGATRAYTGYRQTTEDKADTQDTQ